MSSPVRNKRIDRFKVWIENDPWRVYDDEVLLVITKNDLSAATISVLPEEIDKLIDFLMDVKKGNDTNMLKMSKARENYLFTKLIYCDKLL